MSKKITFTILSMSLLTVMAGAAVAPALGIIQQHFSDQDELLIKLIVSIPSLFIILVNIFFAQICKIWKTRTIALLGLTLYIVCGVGAYFTDNIYSLLTLRALLGVSVGLIMPLSTGLLAYYFPPEEMARLMGLSAAMNQMGGIVATMLAGILASIAWNYAFLVYALGLIAIVMVAIYLPNEQLIQNDKKLEPKKLLKFHPSVIGMVLVMGSFFVFVTNFAQTEGKNFSTMGCTLLMMSTDIVAFFVGMFFGKMMIYIPKQMKYLPPLCFALAYALFACSDSNNANYLYIIVAACMFTGIANGIGVPYLNTIASIKGGKMAVASVMPILSIALYVGQFISPLIVTPISKSIFGDDAHGPYKIGIMIAFIFLIQVISTRHFQSLPPTGNKEE